jgi:hypothetical protein
MGNALFICILLINTCRLPYFFECIKNIASKKLYLFIKETKTPFCGIIYTRLTMHFQFNDFNTNWLKYVSPVS